MSFLFYHQHPHPAANPDPDTVRETMQPVVAVEGESPAGQPAQATQRPNTVTVQVDGNPALTGLASRQLAPPLTTGVGGPLAPAPKPDRALTSYDYTAQVNSQVSTATSGVGGVTGETTGRWGHPSLSWSEGLAPTQDGVTFGQRYFAAADEAPTFNQSASGSTIAPDDDSAGWTRVAAASAVDASRSAYRESLTRALFG